MAMSSANALKVGSGVGYLDRLINCFNIGDNVIWQVETGAFVELFSRAFIRESVKEKKDVVYVSFNNSPKNILAKIGPSINDKNVVIVDCFTSGKGENAGIFLDLYKTAYTDYKCSIIHVERPGDAAHFIGVINRIEEAKPRGTRYVFDSLTGMQDLWGGDGEQIMRFFTRQCPRLYELDTIAYWILEKNAHSEQFRAQLSHITQDVINLTIEGGVCSMAVIKAENHPESGMLKGHRYEVVNGTIEFLEDTDAGNVAIGRKIRELRQQKVISQAELARAVGVTPSTISQAESNAIGLSVQALLRLSKALGISIGDLFEEEQPAQPHFIFRAKNRNVKALKAKGITFDGIIPEGEQQRAAVYIVTVPPGVETDAHFLASKGTEVGFVLSGHIELEMKQRSYTLNEGDAVCFSAETPSRWKNSSAVAP
jgi:transcriptional regulator with XRE-family HTH domain